MREAKKHKLPDLLREALGGDKFFSQAAVALVLTLIIGCGGKVAPPAPATQEEATALKKHMNIAFAALEMYSVDNSLAYPHDLAILKPKYLDEIPFDPVSRQALTYEKTPDGFLLGTKGDYSGLNAEPGYPKMNQDGFFVFRAADFPLYD